MGKYEITQGQWDAVMSNKFSTISGGKTTYGAGDNYPIYYATWYAQNDEIPIIIEDDSLDALIERVKLTVPKMLETNKLPYEGVHFHSSKAGINYHF